jgi:hypothetical protein
LLTCGHRLWLKERRNKQEGKNAERERRKQREHVSASRAVEPQSRTVHHHRATPVRKG